MSKRDDNNTNTTTPDRKKPQTAIYIPRALFARLVTYLHDKYPGKSNMRTRVISDAIDEKLEREGY